MRSSNAASFAQAQTDGSTHFVVDNRGEACEECRDEFEGDVFSMDETDKLPPVHPNCACVPVYFNDKNSASEWSDSLQQENLDLRQNLEDKGLSVKSDGTSSYTNN